MQTLCKLFPPRNGCSNTRPLCRRNMRSIQQAEGTESNLEWAGTWTPWCSPQSGPRGQTSCVPPPRLLPFLPPFLQARLPPSCPSVKVLALGKPKGQLIWVFSVTKCLLPPNGKGLTLIRIRCQHYEYLTQFHPIFLRETWFAKAIPGGQGQVENFIPKMPSMGPQRTIHSSSHPARSAWVRNSYPVSAKSAHPPGRETPRGKCSEICQRWKTSNILSKGTQKQS